VLIVAKKKRSLFDEIAKQLGELVSDLERLINPQKRKPVKAPVPVPVRNNEPRQRRPYR
jgi:hypothetical protein